MSRAGDITLTWGDGEHLFRLGIGQLRELQEKASAVRVRMGAEPIGPAFLAAEIGSGRWLVDDLRETLRLGLIGGGLKPLEALTLVQRYVDDRPLNENVIPAYAVLSAALVGALDEPVGKEAPAGAEIEDGVSSPLPDITEPPL
ncbi:GTA-gp10 family protein [Azorhizobium sp. AG788]|uniref:gene transfer agent family protein n=1 Tax=Azorhizobium sp. AG788 TaxID=2183897 RepID=UPI0031399134